MEASLCLAAVRRRVALFSAMLMLPRVLASYLDVTTPPSVEACSELTIPRGASMVRVALVPEGVAAGRMATSLTERPWSTEMRTPETRS